MLQVISAAYFPVCPAYCKLLEEFLTLIGSELSLIHYEDFCCPIVCVSFPCKDLMRCC